MSHYKEAILQLEAAYQEALSSADFSKIYATPHLSGVFLACPDETYFESKRKVLFIGQEPKAWRTYCPIRHGEKITEKLIRESMFDTLKQSKLPAKKHKLIKFYKRCSLELAEGVQEFQHSAVYSNQFCMSFKKRSPDSSPAFSMIADLSKRLLKAQFDILKPDVAIFTTGSDRDSYIKQALENYRTVEVIVPRRLWHFQVNDTHCFRINHPSAQQAIKLEFVRYQNDAIEKAKSCTPISVCCSD
ncbi:hypothetical protein [Vibrio sp. F74]|uniref:hypothetical protein n=1 Tax=Vibrio sp. F74 TaxID=700020 RepID=UPI0035F5651F